MGNWTHEYSEHCGCENCAFDLLGCPRCRKRRAPVRGGLVCVHCSADELQQFEEQRAAVDAANIKKLQAAISEHQAHTAAMTRCTAGMTTAQLDVLAAQGGVAGLTFTVGCYVAALDERDGPAIEDALNRLRAFSRSTLLAALDAVAKDTP